MQVPKIGIIAGNGLLPISLAENFVKQGGQCYIAILEDASVQSDLYKNFSHEFFKIGMVGAIIKYFRKHNVTNLIFAGGVNRPNLRSIKVDLIGSALLACILKQKFLGDDKVLTIISNFLIQEGFTIISSYEILNGNNNIITKVIPSSQDIIDIKLGVQLLNKIGEMDVGQSVIVEDGYILGIEAAEGTDNLIKRCTVLRKNPTGGVLVKMMKNSQNDKIDIPTIGLKTIENLAIYGYKGVSMQQNKVIIIDPQNVCELANKYNLFISFVV